MRIRPSSFGDVSDGLDAFDDPPVLPHTLIVGLANSILSAFVLLPSSAVDPSSAGHERLPDLRVDGNQE